MQPTRISPARCRLLACVWFTFVASSQLSFAAEIDFERDVAPLLIKRCLECHGAVDSSGGLDLTQAATLLRGGDSGKAVDDSAEKSLLFKRLADGEMPPEKNGKSQALPAEELETFKAWIKAGATWPSGRILDPFERTTEKRAGRDWWAWQPLARIEARTGTVTFVYNKRDRLFCRDAVSRKSAIRRPAR